MTSRPPPPRPPGQVDVQQHHLRPLLRDHGDGLLHGGGLAHHLDARVQVCLQAGAEDGVVVHDHHPDRLCGADGRSGPLYVVHDFPSALLRFRDAPAVPAAPPCRQGCW